MKPKSTKPEYNKQRAGSTSEYTVIRKPVEMTLWCLQKWSQF